MKLPSCTEEDRLRFSLLALFFAVALANATVCWGHPDLIAQIEALTARLAAQPDNVELLLKRGDLHRRHQDYAAAARDFDQAARIHPTHLMLDFYRGRLQQETGNSGAADRLFAGYLERRPGHAKAWKLRGEVNLSRGVPEQAAGYFKKAIELATSPSPDLYRLRVMALIAAGEPHWSKAMESVEKGLNRFGLEMTLLGLGTDISLASGQTNRANELIGRLPGKLMKLPQWTARNQLLTCFLKQSSFYCLQQARTFLGKRAQSFLRDYSS